MKKLKFIILVIVIIATATFFEIFKGTFIDPIPLATYFKFLDGHSQVPASNGQITKISIGASLDLQEKCAKQASAEFKLMTADNQKVFGKNNTPIIDYTNHYNSKFNRCFISIVSTSFFGTTNVLSISLLDAFEGKVYGSFERTSNSATDKLIAPRISCTITLPMGEEKTCQSEYEFDNLVKPYTEE